MKNDLTSLIKAKYPKLSPGQKKVTDYMFHNLEEFAFSTAIQIGIAVGVSDSTVIRLSYSLGFNSFTEMQNTIQQGIMTSIKNPEVTSFSTFNNSMINNNFIKKTIIDEIALLEELFQNLDIGKIENVANRLMSADQILVMGYYSAFTVAHEFYLKLSLVRPNVFFYRTTETEIQRLYDLTENSLVIAVSFPKHIKGTLKFIKQAQKQGATVISVAESELAPISLASDISFIIRINEDEDTGFSTMAQALVLFHLIILSIKNQHKEQVLKHIKNIESNLEHEDIYL